MTEGDCSENVDVDALLKHVEGTLKSMVLSRIERRGVDELRKLSKMGGETYLIGLGFVTKSQVLFKTS